MVSLVDYVMLFGICWYAICVMRCYMVAWLAYVQGLSINLTAGKSYNSHKPTHSTTNIFNKYVKFYQGPQEKQPRHPYHFIFKKCSTSTVSRFEPGQWRLLFKSLPIFFNLYFIMNYNAHFIIMTNHVLSYVIWANQIFA